VLHKCVTNRNNSDGTSKLAAVSCTRPCCWIDSQPRREVRHWLHRLGEHPTATRRSCRQYERLRVVALAQRVVQPPPPPLERRPLRIVTTRLPLNEKNCAGSSNKPVLGNMLFGGEGRMANRTRSRLRLEPDRQSKSIDVTHQEEMVCVSCSCFGRTSTATPTRSAPALSRNVVWWKVVGRPPHSEYRYRQRRPLEEQRHQPQTCPAVAPEAPALRSPRYVFILSGPPP
jgi:hypothetical protein